MPYSDADIVNAALTPLGGTPITSLTDGSPNANKAQKIYDNIRDGLLREANWKFAKRLVKLSRSGTAPAFGFDYAYVLPSDWIRTISAHDNDAGLGVIDYEQAEVNGTDTICASVEDVYLKYIYRVTDPNRFSQGFRRAFEEALARDLAMSVANSNTLFTLHRDEAKTALRKAKSTDSMQQPLPQRPRGTWVTSRERWGTIWPR